MKTKIFRPFLNLNVQFIFRISLCLFLSFIISQKTNAQAVTLADALRKDLISLSVTGEGGHSGECLKVRLENKTRKKLDVRIPAGQVFEATDSSLQNLMVSKGETLLVESGKPRIARLFGFCVEANDGSPGDGSSFTLGNMAEGKLLQIAEYLSTENLHKHPSAQYAVWAVSDEERLEGIGDARLAKYVADLLGKPVPKYHIQYEQPESRMLPGQPANWREAFALNGLFYYDLDRDQKVTFGLYDENGELKLAFFKNRTQLRGQHKFRFGFEVKGLPKGNYFVRMTNAAGVVKELAVEF